MTIKYDNKRSDITFCTMLFKMPQPGDLNSLKHMQRKFEEFYLPSLKTLINTFKKVALWCDEETAYFIKLEKLEKYVDMRVMNFSELPHYDERDEMLKLLHGMRGNVGYLFHHKTPEQWVDYLILIGAKPSVFNWAAQSNKFKSKYFMWIDAGSFHPMYEACWENWNGKISAKPKGVRMTISPTLGKTRPHFVPNFIYRLYKKFQGPISPATVQTLAKQSLIDIAMINADYDVPACCFMGDVEWAHKFYMWFEQVRSIMKRHGLISTEQAVFQAMMKFDTENMFELSYIHGYKGAYAAIAKEKCDCVL